MPGIWTFSEKVKRLTEELEPGVHTFIPVNLRVRDSDKKLGSYYILRCGNIIDAVNIDETDFRKVMAGGL